MNLLSATALIVAVLLLGALVLPPSAPSVGASDVTPDHVTTNRNVVSLEQYRIAGLVIDKISRIGYAGFTIKASLSNAPHTVLSTGQTDTQGQYEIRFDSRPADISIDLFNRANQKVKSIPRLPPNSRGLTQVDFFLLRKEAVPYDFCCSSNNSMGGCPPPDYRLTEFINQLKLQEPKFRRIRAKAYAALMQPVDPANDCGESRKTAFLELLKQQRPSKLLEQVQQTCIDPSFPSKTFATGRFKIQYVEQEEHPFAVPAARPTTTYLLEMPKNISLGYVRADLDVPEYIQQIGLIAEHALSRFINPPLSLKDPRGKNKDVPLRIALCPLDVAGATAVYQDYIEIHTKNSLVQNFGTVPHEIFHRVQYQYNNTGEKFGLYQVMREGGARLIEDSICDRFNRYALQSQKIFKDPAQSLLHFDTNCDNPIGYAAALLWKYLAEQHSLSVLPPNEPDIGMDVYKQILIATADLTGKPYQPVSLRDALPTTTKPGSFDEFSYLHPVRAELKSNETSWGNYLLANYLQSSAPSDSRFRYMESRDQITWPAYGTGLDPISALSDLQVHTDELICEQNSTISRTVVGLPAYAARYYRITPSTSARPRALQISLNGFGGMSDPLIQILSFGSAGVLTDISKSDRASYIKTINMTGMSSVVVIVASRMNAGDYTLRIDEIAGGPDPMITRWNSAMRTEYEVDPRDYLWTQSSPDLMIDNNNDYQPDAGVIPNINNILRIRLHNRGNAQTPEFALKLSYQVDAPQFNPKRWLPVSNASGEEQTVSKASLAAAGNSGDSNWFTVTWAPQPSTSTKKLCVKAVVQFPRDLNTDNNVAIGCFAQANLPR